MSDSSVSAGPGLPHDLSVVGVIPCLGLISQSLCRPLNCMDGKLGDQAVHGHDQGQWGCTVCRVQSKLITAWLPLRVSLGASCLH